MNKSKKIINALGMFLSIIYLLITVFIFGIIIYIKVMPIKYIVPLILVYLIISIIIIILAFNKRIKKVFKIINIIFISFVILISSFGLYYLNSTLNLMDKIKAKDYQLVNYYVIVLKDSNINEIEGLKNKTIGLYDTDDKKYNEAFEKINGLTYFNTKHYDDYLTSADALLEKEIDSMLISNIDLIFIEHEIEEFEESIKIIHTDAVKIENETVVKEVNVTEEPFNIYISGIDVYGDISSVSRSDVNIVASINPRTNQILLTSIPRDYYVPLHDITGYKDKLTHAGLYGVYMSVRTIEDLLDIDINYYVRVNFTTLINLVDAIGGIDVYSDYSFKSKAGYYFSKGINHMNGKQALAFSRERKAFVDGDRQRGKNQQKVIEAILKKTLSSKTLIMKYTDIINSLSNSFETNISSNQIYKLVNMQLDKMPNWQISNYSLDGTDSYNYTYSYKNSKLYVMEPNMKTVDEAKEKIQNIFN